MFRVTHNGFYRIFTQTNINKHTEIMEKKTLFHGTTKENYESIMREGFCPGTTTWVCSHPSEMYFYDMGKPDDETETDEEIKARLIQFAFESAAITAAISGVVGAELVVFEVEIDSDYCEDDFSAPNMDTIATVVNIDDLNEHGVIKNIHTSNQYNPGLRFFYLPAQNPQHGVLLNVHRLSDTDQQAYEMICELDSSAIYDDLYSFEWETENVELAEVA